MVCSINTHCLFNCLKQVCVDLIPDCTRLLKVKVNSPEEAEELFDLISYEKGASVIRMLAEIIGRETFREGMHNYLEAFKFSNADQNDLWRFLQAAYDGRNGSAVDLTQMMESWTLQEVRYR